MRNRFWLAGGLSALALVLLASAPARAETANIEKMFREGVDAFEMGDFATAKRLLEKVIELDPTSEEASRLVKECGLKTMIRMMTEPAVGRGPHRVWDLYREFQRARVRNEERTREMVGFVVDDKTPLPTVWKYMQELQDIGQFAVPALAPHLANEKDDDMRTRARIACTKLGAQAVLPLIELLEHESLLMKQNAALILGDIEPSDSRAVGPLKRAYEDPKSPETLKAVAAQALEKITGLKPGNLKPAREYYYLKADRYYREAPGVSREAEEAEGVVWHLGKDGSLKKVEVPRYAWNEELAEQACYDLLAVDVESEKGVSLLACVFAQQISETQDLQDITVEKGPGRPLSADEVEEIKSRKAKLADAELLIRSVGARPLYKGLDKALTDSSEDPKAIGVSVVLMNAIKDVDVRGELLPGPGAAAGPAGEKGGGHDVLEEIELLGEVPVAEKEKPKEEKKAEKPVRGQAPKPEYAERADGEPLCKALLHSDERVRYAAAIALAYMDPLKNFANSSKVVSNLADAIGESGPLQVLVVENDPNVLNDLKSRLEGFGYGVIAEATVRAGLAQARNFPPKDVILVGRKLPDDGGWGSKELIRELANDTLTAHVPVGVISSHAELKSDLDTFGESVKLIPREDQGRDLSDAIEALASTTGRPVVSKLHAHEIAVAAAVALGNIDPYHTFTVPADCTQACISALTNRKDDLRNPCILALGKFKMSKAFQALGGLFADKQNTLELRANALWALGQIKPAAFAVFLASQKGETEYRLRMLAAQGHGKGAPPMNTILRFLDSERIDKAVKEE